MQTAAILACTILAALGLFQLALAAGAPLGHYAWGGQHRVLPVGLRIGSLVTIGIYAVIGLVLLTRAGLADGVAPSAAETATWGFAGYFLFGIVLNAASRSVLERWTMTPVDLVLAVLTLVVAMGERV